MDSALITVDVEIEIARPPGVVFDYLARPSNMAEYISPATSVRAEARGRFGVRSVATVEVSFLGVTFRQRAVCTVHRRPQSFAARSLGRGVKFWGRFDLTAVDEGTRFRGRGRADLGGLVKIAEPLVQAVVRRQVESDLRRLKRRLEA